VTGDGNRLETDGTYNYTYDLNGNTSTQTRISDGQVTTYTWDYRNRLTQVDIRDNVGALLHQEKYTYDVADRRIGVWVDADGAGPGAGAQSWTVYDGANAWADFDGSGSLTMRYLNGPGLDQRYARVDPNGNAAWYLTDNMGSVRQILNTNGAVLDALTYSAFGIVLTEANAGNGDRFKYTGREWSAGTDQYYYRARYLGARVGRFSSEDPMGFAAGDSNLFRYVGNAPADARDATGLEDSSRRVGRGGDQARRALDCLGIETGAPLSPLDAFVTLHDAGLPGGWIYQAAHGNAGLYHQDGKPDSEWVVKAIRHCVWQALITISRGADVAETIGNIHERNESPDDVRSTEDLHNNVIGRRIGEEALAELQLRRGLSADEVRRRVNGTNGGISRMEVESIAVRNAERH
jgi:RHS repeat-associated protein